MESRNGGVHGIEVSRPFRCFDLGESGFPEDAAADHLHDIERGADDALVFAEPQRACDREAGSAECGDHSIFALDRMRAGQELSGRLPAQDVAAGGGDELIGRVGLTALELLNR